jgi:hypothetical protein
MWKILLLVAKQTNKDDATLLLVYDWCEDLLANLLLFLRNVGTRAIHVAYYDSLSSTTSLPSRFCLVLWLCNIGPMDVANERTDRSSEYGGSCHDHSPLPPRLMDYTQPTPTSAKRMMWRISTSLRIPANQCSVACRPAVKPIE